MENYQGKWSVSAPQMQRQSGRPPGNVSQFGHHGGHGQQGGHGHQGYPNYGNRPGNYQGGFVLPFATGLIGGLAAGALTGGNPYYGNYGYPYPYYAYPPYPPYYNYPYYW